MRLMCASYLPYLSNLKRLVIILCLAFLVTAAHAQDEVPITQSDREHWSFTPLVKPAVPHVTSARARGPIDAFIENQLIDVGLNIAPEAQPHDLLRRVTFDLKAIAARSAK